MRMECASSCIKGEFVVIAFRRLEYQRDICVGLLDGNTKGELNGVMAYEGYML